ncbi:MAG: glycosyltransferase family 4 protein [Leptospiraceae bacterium]|nr:glycosyltransferase family 4 protein [Leptospiraceae bacterium]
MNRILLLNKYGRWNENSRFLFYNYIQDLTKNGFSVVDFPLLGKKAEESFIKKDKVNSFVFISSYLQRLFRVITYKYYDILWLDSEILPFLPFGLESLLIPLNKKIILQFSDAKFYRYQKGFNFLKRFLLKNKIPYWISHADKIIVTTPELRDYTQNWNQESFLIPPSINLEDYPNRKLKHRSNDSAKEFIIGWTGSKFTTRFLSILREPLKELKRVFPIKLILLGGDPHWESPIPTDYMPYTPENERIFLEKIDIGLQPLPLTLRETGNHSIKILKYMANFKPVISSPVGAANIFMRHSENGFLAKTEDDWYLSLRLIFEDEGMRLEMGRKSAEIVENEFSGNRSSKRIYEIFKE